MKKSEVKNIVTENSLEEARIEPRLVFTKIIGEIDGTPTGNESDLFQPEEWDNVRHITGNLYLAWDDGASEDCLHIYVGEFR